VHAVEAADDFAYHHPVDGSNATHQGIRVMFDGSFAMSRRMSATTFAIWNTPLPAVVFGPVYANGSFTSIRGVHA